MREFSHINKKLPTFTAKLLPKAITDREFKYLHSAVGVADFHTAKLAKEINISKFIYYICIDMAEQFDIITWMGARVGYDIPRQTLVNIAMERGLQNVTSFEDLTSKNKDLLLADTLFYLWSSPTQTASKSWSHGDAKESIGSQIMTDKRNIYNLLMSLYKRWNDPMAELVSESDGGVSWMM